MNDVSKRIKELQNTLEKDTLINEEEIKRRLEFLADRTFKVAKEILSE